MIGSGLGSEKRSSGRLNRPLQSVLLAVGILLIAANLRAPLTAVGPLLHTISQRLELSGAEAGLLSTLPLLAFAFVSPLAPRIARHVGLERTLLIAMVVLAVGIALRSLLSGAAPVVGALMLFVSTLVLSAAIAVANVLLPAIVRQRFPTRVSLLTGFYATTMGLVAALSSGVAVPVAAATPAGWRLALGCWSGLALLGAVVWLPTLHRSSITSRTQHGHRIPWRSPLAWYVTAFMGLQSFGYYVVITWLPSLLAAQGSNPENAGWLLFTYQLVNVATALVLPLVIGRMAGQRVAACAASLCCGLGYGGLILAPGLAVVWTIIAGIGGGGCFVLALSFFGLRANSASQAAALSAMAQSVGYLIAAVGPFLFGLLHDATGNWTLSSVALFTSAVIMSVAAIGAGRPVQVEDSGTPPPEGPAPAIHDGGTVGSEAARRGDH